METIEQQLELRTYRQESNAAHCKTLLFDILSKISSICINTAIPFHLHGKTALAAWRDHTMCDSPEICIDVADADRFIRAIDNAKDSRLKVAGMHNDAFFPEFALHVYDPETIDYDIIFASRQKNNCLHVKVHFLLHKPTSYVGKAISKAFAFSHKGISRLIAPQLSFSSSSREKGIALSASKITFSRLVSVNCKNASSVTVANKKFDQHFFDNLSPISLHGIQFFVPRQTEKYFKILFNKDWTSKPIEAYTEKPWHFRDAFRSWDSVAEQFNGLPYIKYLNSCRKLNELTNEEKPLRRQASHNYRIVDRTHYRHVLWAKYMPQKEHLMNLYNKQDFTSLESELKDYFDKLEFCRKHGLGLCFDSDLLTVAMDTLRATNRAEYAEELLSLVPPEHRLPIEPSDVATTNLRYEENHQKILFDMLKRLVDFMDAEGIQYYLLGGSCIGALRHKGFIPWDDDIDLMIDRANFQKLFESFNRFPYNDMELNCLENNSNWRRSFAQVTYTNNAVYTNTTFINHGHGNGTRIDLMIIDDVPADKIYDYAKDSLLYQEVNMDAIYYSKRLQLFVDDYVRYKKQQARIGRYAVVKHLKDKIEAYAKTGAQKKALRTWIRRVRAYDSSWLEGERYEQFEGLQVRVPARAEACLRLQYGYNWYAYPKTGRVAKHDFRCSWDFPGRIYQEDIERFIDLSEAEKLAVNRKILNVQRSVEQACINTYRADVALRRILYELNLEKNANLLHSLVEDGKHDLFLEFLSPLQELQSKLHLIEPECKLLPEVVVTDWTTILAERGIYYSALRLIEALEMAPGTIAPPNGTHETTVHVWPSYCKGKLTKTEQETQCTWQAKQYLEPILNLAEAYQDGNLNKLAQAYNELSDDIKVRVPDAIMAHALLVREGLLSTPWEVIRSECENYLAGYPDNQEIRKTLGDALWEIGEKDTAMTLYKDLYPKTLNGLHMLDLQERFGFEKRS